MLFLKKKSFKMLIFAAFACLTTVILSIQLFYVMRANNKLVENFETNYFAKVVISDTSALVDKFFESIESTVNILSSNFSGSDITKHEQLKFLFLNCLKEIKQSVSVALSFKDGTFFEAKLIEGQTHFRDADNGMLPNYVRFAFRSIEHIENSKMLRDRWQYLSDDLICVTMEEVPVARNMSKSGWYITAELRKEAVWFDPIIQNKEIEIVLSRPVGYCNDATAVGVIAVTLAASKVNEILKNAIPSENSVAYLISQKDEIISSSSDFQNIQTDGRDVEIVQSTESNDEILTAASRALTKIGNGRTTFTVNGVGYIAAIQELKTIPFSLLVIIPRDDFVSIVSKTNYNVMIVTIIIFILSVIAIILLAHRFSNPIRELCMTADSISKFSNNEYIAPPKSEIAEIAKLSDDMDVLNMSRTIFAKYSPVELIAKLVEQRKYPEIGGETKKITILFTDIANFSTLSENLPAEYLILHLSEYLEALTDELVKQHGTIDKYIGDAIMAVWGAQEPDHEQIVNACNAAFNCQSRLRKLEKTWAPLGKPSLPTRIGIHTGQAIVGNVGSPNRMNFTTIGDIVNIASRLESANKFYGTKIIVSEDIANEAKGRILFRIIDRIAVKGKNTAINIYEPLCTTDDTDSETYYKQIELSAKSKEAFELYQMQEFARALERYERIVQLFPNVLASVEPVIKRCRSYVRETPENFDGVFYMDSK